MLTLPHFGFRFKSCSRVIVFLLVRSTMGCTTQLQTPPQAYARTSLNIGSLSIAAWLSPLRQVSFLARPFCLGGGRSYWAGQRKGQQDVLVAAITVTSLLLAALELPLPTSGGPRNLICSQCGHRCFAFSSSQTWWQASWASAAHGTFPVGVGFMNTICMPKDYCGRV